MPEDYTANKNRGKGVLAGGALSTENTAAVERLRQELLIGGYSQRTILMYTSYVEDFLRFSGKPTGSAERQDIVSYMAMLKEKRNVSNATLALSHAALKYFFHNLLHLKIVDDIKIPRKANKLPTVLSRDEIKALIKAARAGRSRLIIEFLYSAGVRVSEAANLKLNDLDLHEAVGMVKGGKGKKDRVIILSREWIKEVKKYIKRKKTPSEFVFSKKNGKPISADTIQRIVKEAAEKAGIGKRVSPHSLRHSYATHLLESGENIRKIQVLLGHSNLSTTQIYTKVSTDELKKVRSPLDSLAARKPAAEGRQTPP